MRVCGGGRGGREGDVRAMLCKVQQVKREVTDGACGERGADMGCMGAARALTGVSCEGDELFEGDEP